MDKQIFYISDTHFNHRNILKFDDPQHFFTSIEEHDKYIINAWNCAVKKQDTVYFLGDLGYLKKDEAIKVLSLLNGNKYIIKGNHDKTWIHEMPKYSQTRVKGVYDYLKISDNGRKVILCHFPIMMWDGQHAGFYHIYGHVHNSKEERIFQENGREFAKQCEDIKEFRAMNAGCVLHSFRPRTLDELCYFYNISNRPKVFVASMDTDIIDRDKR